MTKFAYCFEWYEICKKKAFLEKDENLKKFFQNATLGWYKRAMNLRLSECGEIIF